MMCDLQKLATDLFLKNIVQAQVLVFCFDALIGSLLCKLVLLSLLLVQK